MLQRLLADFCPAEDDTQEMRVPKVSVPSLLSTYPPEAAEQRKKKTLPNNKIIYMLPRKESNRASTWGDPQEFSCVCQGVRDGIVALVCLLSAWGKVVTSSTDPRTVIKKSECAFH